MYLYNCKASYGIATHVARQLADIVISRPYKALSRFPTDPLMRSHVSVISEFRLAFRTSLPRKVIMGYP
jgi:hypothetical protein